MLKKISNNLFYLFIFLLPWQTVFIWREIFISKEKWQYGTIGIYFTDIILALWIILVLGKKFKKTIFNFRFPTFSQIQITDYPVLIVSFILWSFFSIFWSPDKTLAFYFSLKLLLGAGLFFALQEIKINWRKFTEVFLSAAVLQSALAISQFTFQRSFSNKWLGMSNYDSWRGGISVLENEGGRWLRAYGSFPHPNILGGYLALAFIVGLYFLLNSYKNNAVNLNQITILSGLLIIFLGILLTFSRSAWLALVVGIIFLSVFAWRKGAHSKNRWLLKKVFIQLGLIFGLAGIVFTSCLGYNFFLNRFNTGERLEKKSINDRSLYFKQAEKIIKENFWLGTGAGNYTLTVFQKDKIKKPIWQYQPVHNVFMLVWAELGITGLILFLAILIKIFLIAKRNENVFMVAFIMLGILFFLDHWFWDTHFGMLLFWLIIGLAVKKDICYSKRETVKY